MKPNLGNYGPSRRAQSDALAKLGCLLTLFLTVPLLLLLLLSF